MADPSPRLDARLAEGVKYFEQMLQLMPDDRTTLEFLAVAYEQLREKEKCDRTIVALAGLHVAHGDLDAAKGLLPRLEAIGSDEAKVLALRIRRLAAPVPKLVPEETRPPSREELAAEETRSAVDAEVALVDLLESAGLVSAAGDAGRLRAQLRATPAGGPPFLVSALAILEKENRELCEKCVAHLADAYSAPPVALSAFERKGSPADRYPVEMLRIRGVVPFAGIGDTDLVAVLNPADRRLLERLSGIGDCRFFTTMPSAAEAWLAGGGEGEDAS